MDVQYHISRHNTKIHRHKTAPQRRRGQGQGQEVRSTTTTRDSGFTEVGDTFSSHETYMFV